LAKKNQPGFEELLAQAEEIVDSLESGGQGLEDSLKLYEKGVENLRLCAKIIGEAEEKVKILLEKSKGAFTLEDFEAEDEDTDQDD
jgi:exodeoxyribonuclease VII small subunit